MGEKVAKGWFKDLVIVVGLAAVYFVSGKFGLRMAFVNPSATAVWPPTGISLAALALLGSRFWPGIFLGAFLANVTTAGNWATSLGIAVGNTLEAVVGVYCLQRFAGGLRAFEKAGNVFKFVAYVAMFSTMVSATFGVTALSLGGFANWNDYGSIWLTWWLGDMVSDIVLASFLLIWTAEPSFRLEWKRVFESVLLFVLLVLAGMVVFGNWHIFRVRNYPLEYLGIPFLLWAVFRLGPREAVTSAFVMSGIAIWGTLNRFGPFVADTANESLLLLQVFMAVITATMLTLIAVLSEQKKAEQSLKEYAQKLEYSNKELEQFAYVASHDLQEPLRRIITFGDLVKRNDGSASKEGSDYINRMQAAAFKMKRLIEDLLGYSRVTTLPDAREVVDLNVVVQDVLQDMEMRVKELNGTVEVGLLPFVRANELQMKQLFQNLVANSLKFSKKDEAPHILIQSQKAPHFRAAISIQDNGIGFDEKYLDRIFKPFQKLHSRQEYEGSGIGLAICQKVVHGYGGEIKAKSQPGKGTVFIITLPVA